MDFSVLGVCSKKSRLQYVSSFLATETYLTEEG